MEGTETDCQGVQEILTTFLSPSVAQTKFKRLKISELNLTIQKTSWDHTMYTVAQNPDYIKCQT